ncbi:MAG: cupin domain-containing protein [Gammaproteobacteria bacterium]
MRAIIERLKLHSDPRGIVFDPLPGDDLPAQRNVHMVLTEPGAIRGNHYHTRGTEVLAGAGPLLIRLRDGDARMELQIAADEAIRVTIPAGVAHAIMNTGDKPSAIVSFSTESYDREEPDVVREVLIEM